MVFPPKKQDSTTSAAFQAKNPAFLGAGWEESFMKNYDARGTTVLQWWSLNA
jgi:hypothetical protein